MNPGENTNKHEEKKTKQGNVGIRDALIRAMRRTGQMPKNQPGEDTRELSFQHQEVFAALAAGDEDHGQVVYLIDRNAAHEDDEKTIRTLAAMTGLDIPRPLHTDYKHKDGMLCYTLLAEIPLAPGSNQQHAKNIQAAIKLVEAVGDSLDLRDSPELMELTAQAMFALRRLEDKLPQER